MDSGNLKKYGSYERMLSAYNSGKADAYKDPHFAGGQTYNYVRDIMGGKTPKIPVGGGTAGGGSLGLPGNSGAPATSKAALLKLLTANNTAFINGQSPDLTKTMQALKGVGAISSPSAGLGAPGAAPSSRGAGAAVKTAQSELGVPYQWGGESTNGFDCSGLLQYAWGKAGVKIPRTSQQQYKAGTAVGKGQLAAGDAVFFAGSDGTMSDPGHVGIYVGNGKFIESPHTGATVRVSTLAGRTDYVGARRY